MRKLLFAVALLPVLASGAVYKCTDASGRINFSDRPCAGAAQGGEVDVKSVNSGGTLGLPADHQQREQQRKLGRAERDLEKAIENRAQVRANEPCKDFSSTEIRTMTIQNRVVVGMKIGDAVKAWGTPSRVNGRQYVYRWGDSVKGSYFYAENGCVSSVDGQYRGSRFVR